MPVVKNAVCLDIFKVGQSYRGSSRRCFAINAQRWNSVSLRAGKTSTMELVRYATVCLIVIGIFVAKHAQAISIGGWDPIKTAVKVVTAPTQTVVNAVKVVVQGANPNTILDPAKNAAASAAPLPTLAADVVTWPKNQVYKEARALAAKTGNTGDFIFDVATFGDNYLLAMTKASGQAATNVMLGQNPLQFVAMPLAAAIREARDRHIAAAKPLPADVKVGLASIFPKSVLDRARYVVGNVQVTLPNGIGKVRRFLGEDFGVVVDDVIVFPTDPGGFWNNPSWWGHEVAHVEQYAKWGVEEFAFRYVQNHRGNVEDPADSRGEAAVAWARANQNRHGVQMTAIASKSHDTTSVTSEPLLPAAYVQQVAPPSPPDPAIVRFFFPNDSPAFEYYGTKNGRIIVVDNIRKIWIHIGWAAPPDIQGPAWVYFIPGRGSYDVLPNGAIMQRHSMPFGPNAPIGPPIQVGYVARLQ